jgi:zinc transport system permease protein
MLDDFVWRGLAAGLGVALAAGPLGCFVVWRRMAYFGASLAHAALLGVALGFLLGIDLTLGIVVTCLVLAVCLVWLQKQRRFPTDTLLGIMAHAALALGLVVIALMEQLRVDLLGYLFGDILAVTMTDLAWVLGGAVAALGILLVIWRPLLALTVDEELARAEGVPTGAVHLAFMLLVALVIAIAMKVIGILLIVSLLIIPAAAARPFARSPEAMAALAVLIGIIAVVAGLSASLVWDTPSGPSVVVAATICFAVNVLFTGIARRLRT